MRKTTVGITDDDATHTHPCARAYFLYFTFLSLGLCDYLRVDRIGLRILLLSSLDRSDFGDLARVNVTEVFDELEIAHRDELLNDIGAPFIPFVFVPPGLGRTRGNGPTPLLARTDAPSWSASTCKKHRLISIRPDFRKRETKWMTT